MFVGFKQQLKGLVFILKILMMKSLKSTLRGNKTKNLRNDSHVIIKNVVDECSWCWGGFKKLEGKWGSHINLLTFSISQLQERRQHDCLSCDSKQNTREYQIEVSSDEA
jgi:hypothetical protein